MDDEYPQQNIRVVCKINTSFHQLCGHHIKRPIKFVVLMITANQIFSWLFIAWHESITFSSLKVKWRQLRELYTLMITTCCSSMRLLSVWQTIIHLYSQMTFNGFNFFTVEFLSCVQEFWGKWLFKYFLIWFLKWWSPYRYFDIKLLNTINYFNFRVEFLAKLKFVWEAI